LGSGIGENRLEEIGWQRFRAQDSSLHPYFSTKA
jgi:hypothetical protein